MAIGQLGALADKSKAPQEAVEAARRRLEHRVRDLDGDLSEPHAASDRAARQLRQMLLDVQRQEALRLSDEGSMSEDDLHEIERELDLEELELDSTGHSSFGVNP